MPALTRLFIKDRETPSSRVRIRHETSLPANADGANGDMCIVASGASAGVYVHTAGAWTEIGAGSESASLGYYDPSAPPASPHALDREFNLASDVSGMTSWNPGSLADFAASASLSNLVLRTTPQASGTVRFAGVLTAAPATASWSAWTKVSFSAYPGGAVANPCGAGILAVDNAIDGGGAGTADFYCARLNLQRDGADGQIVIASHTNYTNAGSNLYAQALDRQTSDAWFRVRYKSSGTTLHFDYSRDGVGWKQLYQTATPNPVPTRVGLVIVSAAGATDPIPAARFDFLRFSETADVFDATPGRAL